MDPNTSTREQWTSVLIAQSIPDDANAEWKSYTEIHQKLLDKLANHDAVAPNLQQTYMTPAASKNKVYFLWDFVGRTLNMLAQLPPAKDPARYDAQQQEVWSDVKGRTDMVKTLITDSMPGMLNMMVESTNPSERGRHPELGADIVALANSLP